MQQLRAEGYFKARRLRKRPSVVQADLPNIEPHSNAGYRGAPSMFR